MLKYFSIIKSLVLALCIEPRIPYRKPIFALDVTLFMGKDAPQLIETSSKSTLESILLLERVVRSKYPVE